MGRTLPSITQAFLNEQQSLARFRRALRLEDQRALDDLLGASRRHLAAAAYASHLLPFEVMLLSMLVEEHKQVLRLQQELDVLKGRMDRAQDDPKTVGAIHELPPRQQEDRWTGPKASEDGDAAISADDIHEHPLREHDRERDPGGPA